MNSKSPSLCDLLGLELPIIQAPMAGVQGSAMTIAVANAGGLGSLPCAMLSPELLRKEISAIVAATDRPYNLNFFCHTQPEPEPDAETRWRAALAPYYAEYGIDPSTVVAAPSRKPFSAEAAAILEEFRPPVVSFHFGLPAENLLRRMKAFGAKVLASATTVEEAVWLEQRGADAIIAQGLEAGGHRGMFLTRNLHSQIGMAELVRGIVEAVKVPVIAAGGIANSKAAKAAMELGASGVQIGTAYLLCHESTISNVYRAALTSPAARTTALTNIFSGGVARGIVNRAMKELGPISAFAPPFPLASSAIAPLRAKAESDGLGDFSPLWCGQDPTGCKAVSAFEMTRSLAADLT